MSDVPLLRQILTRRMLTCLLAGFASGMPYFVIYQMVAAWLRDAGVGLIEIGLFGGLGSFYNFKFLWAPFLDRYVPPLFGRRRGWALLMQIALFVAMAAYGLFDPTHDIQAIAFLTAAVALFSATQDIALDAYRRELLDDVELGLGTSLFVNAYRIAGFVPGGLALVLADHMPWSTVFVIVAGFMGLGILASVFGPEPPQNDAPPRTLATAVIAPLRDFFVSRGDWRVYVPILAFFMLYKIGDNMATALATPFYLDIGFTKTQIGATVKAANTIGFVVGSILGGVVMVKIGINRALWSFGVVQMASILGFAVLSEVGPDISLLAGVVAFEYIGVGLGSTALLAFTARLTKRTFSATQFALFSALMILPRTLASMSSGFIVEAVGYTQFFLICFFTAIPGMLLLFIVAPWSGLGAGTTTDEDAPTSDA